MFELFFSVVLSWYFAVGVSVWLVFLSHIESEGWSEFFLAVLFVCLYLMVDVSFVQLLIAAPVYLIIGVGYSLFRFKRLCMDITEAVNSGEMKRERGLDKMLPARNVSNIVRWIITWPFSALANIIGDTVEAITLFVKSYLIGIYDRIAMGHYNKIRKED